MNRVQARFVVQPWALVQSQSPGQFLAVEYIGVAHREVTRRLGQQVLGEVSILVQVYMGVESPAWKPPGVCGPDSQVGNIDKPTARRGG